MSRLSPPCAASAALALLSVVAGARAAPPGPAVAISVDGRMGQSTAPYVTSAFPSTSGYGASLVAGTRVYVAEHWQLRLRAPLVLMRVEQPAGALYAEAAWGNPELGVTYVRPWLEHDGWSSTVAVSFAVAAPLAEHDSAQLAGRALRLANALEGFGEPALFTPGVLPLTPASSVTLASRRWQLSGSLALPLLIRVSDADLRPENEARPFGLVALAALDAELRVVRWLSFAGSGRLAAQAIAPAADQASPLQPLAAGRADFHLGESLRLSVLIQAPIGGALGGSTVAGGLGMQATF
jgi:hypothetical protein